jgi:sec-independent protein translocase protein TatB
MLDLGFSEMMVIAVVALVVLGPERLPKVARTVGHLIGRMQRYVNDVKSDITREMELDELRKFRQTVEETASSVQSSFTSIESEARAAGSELESLARGDMPAGTLPASDTPAGTDFSIMPPALPADAASAAGPAESADELARPAASEWVEPTVSGAMASLAEPASYVAMTSVAMASEAAPLRGDRRWPLPDAAALPAAGATAALAARES